MLRILVTVMMTKTAHSAKFPPQERILERNLLGSGFSCVLQLPTGCGKTWLAAQTIHDVLEEGRRAVYLAPLRALAEELTAEWKKQFSDFSVGIFTGDYGRAGKQYPVPFQGAQLLVMTPERLDACTRAWRHHWSWLPEVDLVVVDEIHLLNDEHRGPRLEGALSRVRRLNPFIRFLGLSATLGNREELAEWLEGTSYYSSWRPISLTWRIVRFSKASEKPKLLTQEVQRNVDNDGKSLVFVQSRRRAEKLSAHLSEEGISAAHHHAGLVRDKREAVEECFRSGDLDALVATSTLEMGLNLPVRQVILYDTQEFNGIDFQPLSTNTVWQRVGRAGRPGLDEEGEAVLMAPSWDRTIQQYERGSFEPIQSQLSNPQALAEQVVTEVASGLSRTPRQLKSNLNLYLAGHQERLGDFDEVYQDMLEAEMIAEHTTRENGRSRLRLKATRLGWVAVRHMLQPATVLLCQQTAATHDQLSFFDLLLTAACTPDVTPTLPVDFEELDTLAAHLQAEPSFLLSSGWRETIEALDVNGKQLLSALKMALVVREWTRTGDTEAVAERFGCYPFEIARLRDSASRLLTAWPSLLEASEEEVPVWIYDGIAPLDERIRALRRMVEAGIDESAATLTLVSGIGSTFARRLNEHEIRDIEDLALADKEALCQISGISEKRAAQWLKEAADLINEKPASWFEDVGPRIETTRAPWPAEVDPYRLRRALELKVQRPTSRTFVVSGGLEPHKVRPNNGSLSCDCADAAKGNLCKHVLAIRLRKGDATLQRLAHRLSKTKPRENLDLFDLWYDHPKR